jgi:dUTP pyrophosphatase
MNIHIQKLHTDATVPTYAHSGDAGMDLYSVEVVTLNPGERAQVPTGIAVAIPEGYVGLIWDKSGISHRGGIKTLGGVVDAGYRGEILVGVLNVGDTPYEVRKGAKIAQMLIQKVEHPELVVIDSLDETERGERGFGSTGK